MLVHACNTSTQEVEARGLRIHNYTQRHSEFKASPGYLRLCLGKELSHWRCCEPILGTLKDLCSIPSTAIFHTTQIAMYQGLLAQYPEVSTLIPSVRQMCGVQIICSKSHR